MVLFDEIEKAAPSHDAACCSASWTRACSASATTPCVNFEKSLIFLTSNLGAREMMREIGPDFGFQPGPPADGSELASQLENMALAAVRRRFSPEFVNRIDVVITYQPLDAAALTAILDQQIHELQQHVNTRLGERSSIR